MELEPENLSAQTPPTGWGEEEASLYSTTVSLVDTFPVTLHGAGCWQTPPWLLSPLDPL